MSSLGCITVRKLSGISKVEVVVQLIWLFRIRVISYSGTPSSSRVRFIGVTAAPAVF